MSKYLSTNVPDISNMSPGYFKNMSKHRFLEKSILGEIDFGKNNIYIYKYSIHILYIFYAKDCVVERDAAAGQPPGQPSHPAALDPGPGTKGPRARAK